MRSGGVAALVAVALLVGAGAGYIVGVSVSGQRSQTNPNGSATTETTCVTSGPTDGVVLRVVANNGSWAGVRVSGEAVGYCNGQRQVQAVGPSTTNRTGWVSFLEYGLPGIYYLDVRENPWDYNISVVTQPTTTTYAVLNLSTGNLTTYYCEFGRCPSPPTG